MNRYIRINNLFVFFIVGLFCLSWGIIPRFLWAAPSISSVSGTVSDGQLITISGSGFGTHGPTIQVFDDFQNGTNGNTIATSLAQVGSWSLVKGNGADRIYSTDYRHSGMQSMKINGNRSGSVAGVEKDFSIGPPDEVFFSWWQYLPVGKSVPGTNGPESGGPNWKLFWLYGEDETEYFASDYVIVFLSNSLPGGANQFTPADGLGSRWPNGDPNYPYGHITYNELFRPGVWTRYWLWFKAGQSSNGKIGVWQTNSYGFQTIGVSPDNVTTQQTGYPYLKLTLPGYYRKDSNSIFYLDDIYVATSFGAGAQARVEIGNNATYSSCTNLAITTPTSWSDTSITATVRQGSFTNGSSAFLFVFDSNGAVNTTGYPITIGGGGGDTTPPAPPKGLRIIN